MRVFRLVFLLFLLPLYTFSSQLNYDPAYLAKLGIDASQLKIATLSGNNKLLLAVERINNLRMRTNGKGWVLRIFSLSPNRIIVSVRSVVLPVTDIDNLAVSDDGKIAIIVAKYGTELLELNPFDGQSRIIFARQDRKPGFRCRKLIWYHDSHFFTEGYFYDGQGYWLSDAVTSLDLSHPNSVHLFRESWNIGETRKSLGNIKLELLISGQEGFLGAGGSNDVTLYHYDKGKLEKADSGFAYGGWAGTDNRILYSILRENKQQDLIIKDPESGKTWVLANDRPYLYPYLSRDGGHVAIVALMDFKTMTMSYSYAIEKENFNLRPMPDLQSVPIGIFRLSPDGSTYAFSNKNGLMIGTVP